MTRTLNSLFLSLTAVGLVSYAQRSERPTRGATANAPAPQTPVLPASRYLGMETSPVPAGVEYDLSHEIDSGGVEQFVIAHVQTPEGTMLWLARTIVPRHQRRIVDVVPLESAARWEYLSDDCRSRSPAASVGCAFSLQGA